MGRPSETEERQMVLENARRRLISHGVFLFFLGLLSGVAIPAVTNPRMGLSAHMEALLNGMFLILLGGVVWKELSLSDRVATASYWLFLYAAYGSWFFCQLAAVFGASQVLPIASAGFSVAPWQDALVRAGLTLVACSVTLACCFLLYGLRRGAAEHA
jgi:hydroxylaminobenzene mutase